MSKKIKTRKGKDGFDYPYTSPDLVVDATGKSVTKKFEDINSQFKDIANEIDQMNKLYINLSKFGVKPSSQVSYDETTKTYNLSDCSDKIKATLDNKENVVIIFEKGNY